MPLRSDWSEATCPIARTLDVVGDPWVLLILREAVQGVTRYDDFRAALGVADGVLSRRLAAMVDDGLMTRAPYRSGNRTREEYLLTDAGRDLLPVRLARPAGSSSCTTAVATRPSGPTCATPAGRH